MRPQLWNLRPDEEIVVIGRGTVRAKPPDIHHHVTMRKPLAAATSAIWHVPASP